MHGRFCIYQNPDRCSACTTPGCVVRTTLGLREAHAKLTLHEPKWAHLSCFHY